MKKLVISLIVAIIALFTSVSAYVVYKKGNVVEIGDLTVHFIDVGQGDACVVELPDGRKMLIDAGESSAKTKLFDYISTNIKDDAGKTITRFDFVIMTHSDADHIGSMAYILEQFGAVTVYRPNQQCVYDGCDDEAYDASGRNGFWGGEPYGVKNTATYHKALEAAYRYSDEVIVTNPYDDTQNTITSLGDKKYEVNFYSPLSASYDDNNNYSPIIVIEYMGRKIVVSGDAEAKNEAEFVEVAKAGEGRYAVFDDSFCADVIKLGHHGSRTSSSEEYLDVMTTARGRVNTYVVISCGEGNSYGHPHSEVLERLASMGFSDSRILRTDLHGDIVITVAFVDGKYRAVLVENAGYIDGLKIAIIASAGAVIVLIAVIVIKKCTKGKARSKK